MLSVDFFHVFDHSLAHGLGNGCNVSWEKLLFKIIIDCIQYFGRGCVGKLSYSPYGILLH